MMNCGLRNLDCGLTKETPSSNPHSEIRNLKSNYRIWAALDVDGINEAYVARLGRHDERVRAAASAEESHAAKERAVRDSGRDEDHLLAGREGVRVVNLVRVVYPHLPESLKPLFCGRDFGLVNAESLVVEDEPRLNLAVQALHRRRGQHAFGRAADPHQRVNVRAGDRRGDSGGEVAVVDESDTSARVAHVLYQFLVARAV